MIIEPINQYTTNVIYHLLGHTTLWDTFLPHTLHHLASDTPHDPIAPGKMAEPLQQEARVQLAIEALNSGKIKGIRNAAAVFDVPKSTLYRRVNGGGTRQHAQVRNRKLRLTEEAALIQWIELLDDRGISPTIGYIR